MGSLNVNDGVSNPDPWKPVTNMHVRPGATWETVKRVWTHTGTTWVIAWENEITETFPLLAGQTFYNTSTDNAGYLGTAKRTDSRGTKTLAIGDAGTAYPNMRGLWIPGVGSESGTSIGTTLNGRTIVSFKVSIGFDWSAYHTDADGTPQYLNMYGTTYSSMPTTMSSPGTITKIANIAFFPSAGDYSTGAVVTAAQLSVPPNDRERSFRQDVDLTPWLSATAKTQLTNGTINSFLIQAYNGTSNQTADHNYRGHSLQPGQTYYDSVGLPTSNPNPGNADAFRIKVTHTG